MVNKILIFNRGFPYINGLALNNAKKIANIVVDHKERIAGKSKYDLIKLINLTANILFNYSIKPLRLVVFLGLIFSLLSFFVGIYFLISKLFMGYGSVSGWTSTIVMLSFFSSINLLILGLLGEYVVNILKTVKENKQYVIQERINFEET